jgi:hypothetical protein
VAERPTERFRKDSVDELNGHEGCVEVDKVEQSLAFDIHLCVLVNVAEKLLDFPMLGETEGVHFVVLSIVVDKGHGLNAVSGLG